MLDVLLMNLYYLLFIFLSWQKSCEVYYFLINPINIVLQNNCAVVYGETIFIIQKNTRQLIPGIKGGQIGGVENEKK